MALHGEIKVNHEMVAWWEAVRISGGTNPDDINKYRCEVGREPTRSGAFAGDAWSGVVEHRYGDGAVVLASLVLAASAAGRISS